MGLPIVYCLSPALHSLFHFSFNGLFLYRLSFIKKFFPFSQSNLYFCLPVLKINFCWNQGITLFFGLSYKFIYLFSVEEEFSCPVGLRLGKSIRLFVWAYVRIYKKDLFALYHRIAVFQICLSEPQ